jgi:hypothetical protein
LVCHFDVPVRLVDLGGDFGQAFRRWASSAGVGDYSTFAGAATSVIEMLRNS